MTSFDVFVEYCRFQLSYHDLEEMMKERGLFIKKKVRAAQCFKSIHTAERTLEGIEAIDIRSKGQFKRLHMDYVIGKVRREPVPMRGIRNCPHMFFTNQNNFCNVTSVIYVSLTFADLL